MAIDLKELKFYVNYTGKKLKTDGLTLNQNSSNNVIDFICMDQYDVVEIYFKNPAGQISPKYHMINNGIYQKSTDDLEVSEIADNTFHEWKFAIPYAITSFTMTSSTARMEVSFAGYKYDAGNKLVISSTANTQIVVNKSNTSDSLDESYNGTDVENLWKAIGTISEGKQDKLPTVINGRYLHTNETTGELEWSIVQGGSGSGTQYGAGDGILISEDTISVDPTFVATREYVDLTKQDKLIAGQNINIAADGRTISANTGPTYQAGTGIIIKQDNTIEVAQSEISYNNLLNKPTIGQGTLSLQKNGSVIGTFGANATTGKTINIEVPTKTSDLTNDSGYVTNTYHDATKQDVLTAGAGITIDPNTNIISADATGIELVSVSVLPTAGADTFGKIYLVPDTTPDAVQKQTKLEYITLRTGTEGSYVYSWELIGNTDADLSNYYTKSEVNAMDTATRALIPTNTNQLTNGADFQTGTQVASTVNSAIATKQNTLTPGTNITIVGDTINATDTTYSSAQGIELTGTIFKLNNDFYTYLSQHAYLSPTCTLKLLDGNGNEINNYNYNTGDTVTVTGFKHSEYNVHNITGNLTLKYDGTDIAVNIVKTAEGAWSSDIQLSQPITVSINNKPFVLSGVNTQSQTFSDEVEFTFSAPQVLHPAYACASNPIKLTYDNTFQKINDFTAAIGTNGLSNDYFAIDLVGSDTRSGNPNAGTGDIAYILCEDHGTGIKLLIYDQFNQVFIAEDDFPAPTQVTFVDDNGVSKTMWLYQSTPSSYDDNQAKYTVGTTAY